MQEQEEQLDPPKIAPIMSPIKPNNLRGFLVRRFTLLGLTTANISGVIFEFNEYLLTAAFSTAGFKSESKSFLLIADEFVSTIKVIRMTNSMIVFKRNIVLLY